MNRHSTTDLHVPGWLLHVQPARGRDQRQCVSPAFLPHAHNDGRWREGELAIGPTRIDISGTAGADPEFGTEALHIVAVTDVDAQYERIRQTGGEIGPPKDEPYGPRSCHVTDPWGYRWYFWQGEATYPAG
jgi:uncharacterized glyoxalase superfamily protein PhnB